MKNQGDWAFCTGINRFVYHTFAHKPCGRRPGMTMGPYGVHWDRGQTWWPMVSAYHRYITRCQFLLRQGQTVADICYLIPEGAPHVFRPPASALAGTGQHARSSRLQLRRLLAEHLAGQRLGGRRPSSFSRWRGISTARASRLRDDDSGPAAEDSRSWSKQGRPSSDRRRANRPAWWIIRTAISRWRRWPTALWGQSEPPVGCRRGAHSAAAGSSGAATCTVDPAPQPPTSDRSCIPTTKPRAVVLARITSAARFRHGWSHPIHASAHRRCPTSTLSPTGRPRRSRRPALPCRRRTPELWDPLTGAIRELPQYTTRAGRTTVPHAIRAPPELLCRVSKQGGAGKVHGRSGKQLHRSSRRGPIDGPWTSRSIPHLGGPRHVHIRHAWRTGASDRSPASSTTRASPPTATRSTCRKRFRQATARSLLDLGVVHSMAACD